MKKNLIFIAAIGMLLLTGCGNDDAEIKQEKVVAAVPVTTGKVEKETIRQTKVYSGTLEGTEQASIISKIAERVTKVHKNVNDRVSRGAVVVQLERSGATSNYLQSQAAFENAKRDLERMEVLYGEGAVAKQALDQARTQFDIAKANHEASKGTVDLTAPVSGIVTNLRVKEGDWVNPGTELAVVADISRMVIKFHVNETDVAKLRQGDEVSVYSEFDENRKVKGKITEISRAASQNARTFEVKAEFTNTQDRWYKPGMFVNVEAVLNTINDVLTVPNESIIFTNNNSIVYVVRNEQAFPAVVKTGINSGSKTEIESGLSEGETIVTRGMNNLSDSTRVEIVSEIK